MTAIGIAAVGSTKLNGDKGVLLPTALLVSRHCGARPLSGPAVEFVGLKNLTDMPILAYIGN
jgi:hypothetical protein